MITITHDEYIDRPVEDVFAYIANPENDPQWCPTVLETIQIAGDGPGRDTRYHMAAKPGPKTVEGTIEVVDYEPNTRFEWRGSNDAGDFHGWYTLESVNGGARVHMTSILELRGLMRFLEPVINRAGQNVAVEGFQNLKRILETQEPVSV